MKRNKIGNFRLYLNNHDFVYSCAIGLHHENITMNLPFFYQENIGAGTGSFFLDEAASKHIVQVLRMQNGEQIQLTNGKGDLFIASIKDNNRKKCEVTISETKILKHRNSTISIAISLIKNSSRFEWFLEKATELGVTEIIPILCERTETHQFRYERLNNILVSAMIQSKQCRLPVLHEPTKFNKVIERVFHQQKFIAHCKDEEKGNLIDLLNNSLSSQVILIGPEGDFTAEEIQLARQHHFIPVALGDTRLRTETAGIVAASLLCLV